MRRRPRIRARRLAALGLGLAVWLAAPGFVVPSAHAGRFDPGEDARVPAPAGPAAAAAMAARQRGRICTAPGCAGPGSRPWAHAAGFGAAVAAAGWIGRRRPALGT